MEAYSETSQTYALFVCFVALRPKSTAMVIEGRSVHLTTQQPFLNELPSADSFKKGCCQLQAKVCARITGYPLVQACPGKSVVR